MLNRKTCLQTIEEYYIGLGYDTNKLKKVLADNKNYQNLLTYYGDKFVCPFCKGKFKKLLPKGFNCSVLKGKKVVGGGYRSNARCPCCNSSDRERLVYLYLLKKTKIFSQKLNILHIAPERNLQKIFKIEPKLNYVSIDINPTSAMQKMNVTNIKYRDNTFDVVICNHVLEHVYNDIKAMKEIYRVLKPLGWAIIQVPISLTLKKTYENKKIKDPKKRIKFFGQENHIRIYAKDYRNRLEGAGFNVKLYNFGKEFGEKEVQRYALLKEENLYICLKPNQKKTKCIKQQKTVKVENRMHGVGYFYKKRAIAQNRVTD